MSDPNDTTRIVPKRSSADVGGLPAPPLPPRFGANPRYPEETEYVNDPMGGDGPRKTRIIHRDDPLLKPEATPEPKTQLVRRSSGPAPAESAKPADDLPEGPVVGWLVVVEGPGRGKSVTLGFGMNAIGRDPGNRVVLPFGDMQISRAKHATLTYDPRGRKFFIQHGDSSNLTYVGDLPVLSPVELKSGEIIRLGDTTVLKFIPLCGDDFNWD